MGFPDPAKAGSRSGKDNMSKSALMVVGFLLVLMGIAGLIPAWTWASTPQWYAIVKIVIGLISIYVSTTDK